MIRIIKSITTQCLFALLTVSSYALALCTGEIAQPPSGLIPVNNEKLLSKAVKEAGGGQLCQGQVFEATEPLLVYRVWNSEKSYTAHGQWWSLEIPEGPRDKYRYDNVICPEWSLLDKVSICTLKVGSQVVMGPGQSAVCEQSNITISQSPVNQLFIDNNALENSFLVENCTQGINWPWEYE